MKVGDLVKLHPEESIMLSQHDRLRVGLVVEIYESRNGTDVHVLWSNDTEPDIEYEDGLIVVSEA